MSSNFGESKSKPIGTVTNLGDGIAIVSLMEYIMPGELLEFTSGVQETSIQHGNVPNSLDLL